MKKLRIFFTILLLLPFTPALLPLQAQTWFVKAGGGLGSQWGAAGPVTAARIGIGYEYEFNQFLTFAPSLSLATRGWQNPDVDTPDMLFDDQGNRLDADGHITTDPAQQAQRPVIDGEGNPIAGQYMLSKMHRSFTTNYIQLDLPFVYYHRIGESRYLTLTAGPWLACGVFGNAVTEGDGREAGARKLRYTDKTFGIDGAHRIDAGLKAGIGYQFPSSLTVNVEGEFGLIKTNTPTVTAPPAPLYLDPWGNRAARSFDVMITIAYKLNKSKWKYEE